MEKNVTEHDEIPQRPTSIRDMTDSFSLVNVCGGRIRDAVMALDESLLMMTETELRRKAKPTSADFALRVSFWREFERIMWKQGGVIQIKQVIAGIVSEQYFYKEFLQKPEKIAWMVRPMQTYEKEMESILFRATERLWELIEIPIYNTKGRFDSKAAEVLLKAVQQVENRVKGMAIQKSEKRNLNVNVRTKAIQGIETMESLDARLKQLELEVASGEAITDRQDAGTGDDQVIQAEFEEKEREPVEGSTLRDEGELSGAGSVAHTSVQE